MVNVFGGKFSPFCQIILEKEYFVQKIFIFWKFFWRKWKILIKNCQKNTTTTYNMIGWAWNWFWSLYLLQKLCRILSHKLFIDDWRIWTFHLWSSRIKLWSNCFRMLTYIHNWKFCNSYYSKFNSSSQRGYGRTFQFEKYHKKFRLNSFFF